MKIFGHGVQFVENRLGKLLALISGYTYYRDKQYATTHVWRCTKGNTCKARFTLTNDMHLVRAMFAHSHQPANYPCGKRLAIVHGYTFYCHKRNSKSQIWSCTNGGRCRARLIMSNDALFVNHALTEHNHPPPHFVIDNGFYMKI
ncbi:unnamed protein product, partial [Iphiclides podalirius]